MKVWQFLKIQSIIDRRAMPSDLEDDNTEYYSESGQEVIKLMNMEVIHVIRAFKKQLNTKQVNPNALKQFFDLAYEITNERRNK